jgi:glutamate-ammonia-ligase adenylyltransferase
MVEACGDVLDKSALLSAFSRDLPILTWPEKFFRFSEAALDRLMLYSLLKENPDLLGLLVHIFGYSQYLSDILVRNPEYFLWIVELGLEPRGKEDLLSELKETVVGRRTKEGALNALRRFKRREILRIGARDILGLSPIEEITAELSWLAEACLQAALETCQAELRQKHGAPMGEDGKESGFAIVAMGKLGGEELNFSSDIDLLFVYEKDGETSGPAKLSNYIFFTRMGEDVLKAIGGMTDEGYCYRVDMRLRPEGVSGPLVRSPPASVSRAGPLRAFSAVYLFPPLRTHPSLKGDEHSIDS